MKWSEVAIAAVAVEASFCIRLIKYVVCDSEDKFCGLII